MASRKVPTSSKTLLRNVIRHTDTHNRMLEESDMWLQREREMNSRKREYTFLKDQRVDMRYEFSDSRSRRAHMDDEPRSNYWMKELYKAEENDSNRWGHSGFKEMYPEEFDTSYSSSSEGDVKRHKKRSKKHKRHKSRKKKRKRKLSDSEAFENGVRNSSKHRSRKYEDTDYESSSDDSETEKLQKKRRRKTSESSSDSETAHEHRHKRKHKHKSKTHRKRRKHRKRRQDSESSSS